MRMIRLLSLLAVLFCSIVAWGQNTDEFNPVSPGEPGEPVLPDKPEPKPDMFTLTLYATEGGSVGSGSGSYAAGIAVTVTANAAATNHVFLGWINETGDTLSKDRSFVYTMPEANTMLTACYRFRPGSPAEPGEPDLPTPPEVITNYTLTLHATEGGSVGSGSGSYAAGTAVTVTANAAATNHIFLGWINETGDTLSKDRSFVYTMPEANATLTACYRFLPGSPSEPGEPVLPERPEQKPLHWLTVSCAEGGTISVGGTSVGNNGTMEVEEDGTVAVAVTLATNFKFDGWYCADTLYNANKDFTLTMGAEDISLEARYSYTPGSPEEPSVPVTTKNELYLMSTIGLPGEVIQYPLYLNSNDTISDVSMLILFPKGMQADFSNTLVSEDAKGAELTYNLLTEADEEIKKDESLMTNLATHYIYKVSLSNTDIAPTNTPLLIMPVSISDTISGARYRVWLSQVEFTLKDNNVVGGSTRNGAISTAYEDPESYMYLDNLISVGGDTWEVSQKRQLNTATPVSSKRDMKAVISALGCSDVSFVTFKGASAPGIVTDQLNAGSGYWFNKSGYACGATDAERAFSIIYNGADSTLVLTQHPNSLSPGDVVTAKVYFTYKYKYYETAVTFTTEPDDKPVYQVNYIVEDTVYHSAMSLADEKVPLAVSPEKTGYTFAGWNGMPADSIMPAQNLTLTAKWRVNSYTITYMSDGAVYQTATLNYGAEVPVVTAPTKAGYKFDGWDSTLPAIMPAHDITVTAVWTVNGYTITYMSDGVVYQTATLDYGAAIPTVTAPTKTGYTFGGWDVEVPATMPAHDVTVTAVWTVNSYTITYMSDGAVYHTATMDYGAEVPAVAAPAKAGHAFHGWDPAVPATMPAQDITVTAVWDQVVYTVTYIVDGTVYHRGNGTLGQKIQVATSPEKTGYTFAGWDGMPTDSIMPSQDLTLTALWTVNKYGLNYILDGKQLRVDSIAYGETIVPAIPDARLGCEFGGWENIPSVMPADDVTVKGYNHIIDTEEVALDGHLTDDLLSEANALKQVKILDLGAVTNSSLPIGGLATLQTAVLPAGLTGYDGVLTDCPNLLEVTLNSNVTIPSDAFTGSGTNTNMMVYAPAGIPVDYDGNVVVDGVAESITLEDGKALSISREFTAQHIIYWREFSKTSYINECGGWETIVLPFDVESVESNGSSLVPFGNHSMTGDKYYWLAGLIPSGFGVASHIQANVPYIICMPNSPEYIDWYNISGTVTFCATDAVVRRTSDVRAFRGSGVELVPAYQPVERDFSVYSINDEEYEDRHPGALFVSDNRDVRPFEAYVRRTATTSLATMSFAIGEMNATGIMNIGTTGATSAPAYFDLIGRPTTSSGNGLRIMRDKNGRYVKTVGRR